LPSKPQNLLSMRKIQVKHMQQRKPLEDPFSDRLKDEFGGEFRPGNYGIEGDPATDSKLELLKLTIGNPKQKQEIIDRWIKLFPGDKKWADYSGKLADSSYYLSKWLRFGASQIKWHTEKLPITLDRSVPPRRSDLRSSVAR
jgi:hypothetical protein